MQRSLTSQDLKVLKTRPLPPDFLLVVYDTVQRIADDEALVSGMTEAGFTAVFIGIESPSPEALKETHKNQNLRRNVVDQVHWLQNQGLDVYAGFILGFDEEGPDIFNRMIDLIKNLCRDKNMTILLSSHMLHQVQKICHRIGIMIKGRMVAQGDMNHLAQEKFGVGKETYTLEEIYMKYFQEA